MSCGRGGGALYILAGWLAGFPFLFFFRYVHGAADVSPTSASASLLFLILPALCTAMDAEASPYLLPACGLDMVR